MSCTQWRVPFDEFVLVSDESVVLVDGRVFHATRSRVRLDEFVAASDESVATRDQVACAADMNGVPSDEEPLGSVRIFVCEAVFSSAVTAGLPAGTAPPL